MRSKIGYQRGMYKNRLTRKIQLPDEKNSWIHNFLEHVEREFQLPVSILINPNQLFFSENHTFNHTINRSILSYCRVYPYQKYVDNTKRSNKESTCSRANMTFSLKRLCYLSENNFLTYFVMYEFGRNHSLAIGNTLFM